MAFIEEDHSRPRFAGEVEILLGFFDDDPVARAPLRLGHFAGFDRYDLDLGGEFCTPISCGGVSVRPGDAILADENGVLALRPELIESAATEAIRMQAAEKELFARLDAGEKLPDISGATKRVMAKLAP